MFIAAYIIVMSYMQIYIQLDDLGGPFLHGPLSINHLRGMPWILSWSFDTHSYFKDRRPFGM